MTQTQFTTESRTFTWASPGQADLAEAMEVSAEEVADWRDAAEAYPPRPAPEVKVMPMMTARERKARGFTSFLDDPKMAALREAEHEKTVKAARERGGHVIEENRW